jgi:signal transduction histidine kinase
LSSYGDESRLNAKIEVIIYSATLELTHNALKHSGAKNIVVQIIQEADRIAFNVQDDGCGFDTALQSTGMGLQNVRTRVDAFGGILHIDSRVGEGTEINIELNV